MNDPSVDPGHGGSRAERVDDGLFRGFGGGLEERGHCVVRDHGEGDGTVQPPSSSDRTRDDVPMPPLNWWQIMPVPPPTQPSATGPPVAASRAANTCSGRTCIPLMSERKPS